MPKQTEKPMDVVDIIHYRLLAINSPTPNIIEFLNSWADSDFKATDADSYKSTLISINMVLESPAIKDTHKFELAEYKENLLAHLKTLKNN